MHQWVHHYLVFMHEDKVDKKIVNGKIQKVSMLSLDTWHMLTWCTHLTYHGEKKEEEQ